jgi:hypothetical protein
MRIDRMGCSNLAKGQYGGNRSRKEAKTGAQVMGGQKSTLFTA